jgi:adenine-specific DNA-methyltransferase
MIKAGVVAFRQDHSEPPIRKTYLNNPMPDDDANDADEEGAAKVMTSYFFRSSLQASNVLANMFGKKVFDYPKDHEVIARFIDYVTNDDDIVIDAFAGSGSTGHAVLALNALQLSSRKVILVEIDPTIAQTVTRKRLDIAQAGYSYTNKKGVQVDVEALGSGFRYCTLGKPLFDEWGGVTEGVTFPDLAAFTFFSETGSPIPAKAVTGQSLIGAFQDRAIHLLWSADSAGAADVAAGNVLTVETLAALAPHDGPRVVYAEGCTVSAERLAAAGVTFKQVPYQLGTAT